MAATPNQARTALAVITGAAIADLATATDSAPAEDLRSVAFEAVPVLALEYGDAAATLAADWYDELRYEAPQPVRAYAATPRNTATDEAARGMTARVTGPLRRIAKVEAGAIASAVSAALALELQKMVADSFRHTIVDNTRRDPDAIGWRRYARSNGCKFCQMLANKGAIFTRATANFSAHPGCSCTAGPSWDPNAPRASAMQYLASTRNRTPAQNATLRDYLNKNYPDAPG